MSWEGIPVWALIPARAGSKGIRNKNIQAVGGLSLVARAAALARDLPWLEACAVSSDSRQITEEAMKHHDRIVVVDRPAALAGDSSRTEDVWKHAWGLVEDSCRMTFGLSVLLEPTSPFRTPSDIELTVAGLLDSRAEVATTISRTPAHYSPYKALTQGQETRLGFLLDTGAQFLRRQDAPDVFHRNGLCYAATRDAIMSGLGLLECDAIGIVTDRTVVNIDEPLDLAFAEWLWARQAGESLDDSASDPQLD